MRGSSAAPRAPRFVVRAMLTRSAICKWERNVWGSSCSAKARMTCSRKPPQFDTTPPPSTMLDGSVANVVIRSRATRPFRKSSAVDQLTLDHEPDAEPRTDIDVSERLWGAVAIGVRLLHRAERRRVDVVVDHDPGPGRFGDELSEWQMCDSEVRGVPHDAGSRVNESGDADPDLGWRNPRRRFGQLHHYVRDGLQDARAAECRATLSLRNEGIGRRDDDATSGRAAHIDPDPHVPS